MNTLVLSNEAISIAVRDFLKIVIILGVKLVLTNIILELFVKYITGLFRTYCSLNHFCIANKGVNL